VFHDVEEAGFLQLFAVVQGGVQSASELVGGVDQELVPLEEGRVLG